MAKLQADLREFIELLNSHGVEYLVVGGHAVAFHGHPRFTGDMDFFIRATAANVRRVLDALEQFGFGGLGITERDLLERGRIVQLGQPPNRIDLLASITAVEFDAAWAARVPAEMDGVPVHLLGFDDLVLNKRSAARAKDLADVEKLLAVKNRRKNSAS